MDSKKTVLLALVLVPLLVSVALDLVQASAFDNPGILKRSKRDGGMEPSGDKGPSKPLQHTVDPSNFGCIRRTDLKEAAQLVIHDLQHLIDGFNKAHKKFGDVITYSSMALAGYVRPSLETCANFAQPDDVDCATLKEWYVIQSIKIADARTNIYMAITDAMTELSKLLGTVQCTTVCDTCVQLGGGPMPYDRNIPEPTDTSYCVLSFKEATHLTELFDQHFNDFKAKTPLFHQVLTQMTLAISDMNMISSKNLIQKVGEKDPGCPCQADFTLVETFTSAANKSLTWCEDQMNRLCDHAAMQKMDFAMLVKLMKEMDKSVAFGEGGYYGGGGRYGGANNGHH